ncbi:MAG: DUF1330 domain-containing protein [Woeseiaceae bacterium]|nr:DUF1330 domain-containing protein [Woeseiaceae bacterium]
MGAFMFIQADITNPEQFMEYAKRAPALIQRFGGRYRCMRGAVEQLEGKSDNRKIVVSEWPSMQAAQDFWNSPEYQELKDLRAGAAEIDVYLCEITGD